jgi:hypothetical protein
VAAERALALGMVNRVVPRAYVSAHAHNAEVGRDSLAGQNPRSMREDATR